MEEQCSLSTYDLSSLLSTLRNVLVCVVVFSSLVILLYFIHLNRRWRGGTMSGNISVRLQNKEPPSTSTSKGPAAPVEALGIQDSMHQMNIGQSLSLQHNGSWLRSAQDGQFLSHAHPPPTNSLSSSSRSLNSRETHHKQLLKPARLRLIKPNGSVLGRSNSNNEDWTSSNHLSSSSTNHGTNRLAFLPRNGYRSFHQIAADKGVMNQRNTKYRGDSVQWRDGIATQGHMESEGTERSEKWKSKKKGRRCCPSASVVVLLLLVLSVTANLVFISLYISNQD